MNRYSVKIGMKVRVSKGYNKTFGVELEGRVGTVLVDDNDTCCNFGVQFPGFDYGHSIGTGGISLTGDQRYEGWFIDAEYLVEVE